jgi:hypothetical protein
MIKLHVDGKFPTSSTSIYYEFHPPPYITNFTNVKKFSQMFHPCSQLYLGRDFSCWLISFKWLDHFNSWISSMWELFNLYQFHLIRKFLCILSKIIHCGLDETNVIESIFQKKNGVNTKDFFFIFVR